MKIEWERIGELGAHGVYWICGQYMDYEVDGEPIGVPIGHIDYVSLVYIDYIPGTGGVLEVEPVHKNVTGNWDCGH